MTETPCQLDNKAFSIATGGGRQNTATLAELDRRIARAKALCAGCHHLDACRKDLASVRDVTVRRAAMVLAGLTPKEELDRRKAARKARNPKFPTNPDAFPELSTDATHKT